MHFEGGGMHFESGEELLRGYSSGEPSIAAAEQERSRALYGLRVLLRLMGYIGFFAVVFVASATLGWGIAVELNWWQGWPDLVCISIQDCYELLF
jgi:hypothetical protein